MTQVAKQPKWMSAPVVSQPTAKWQSAPIVEPPGNMGPFADEPSHDEPPPSGAVEAQAPAPVLQPQRSNRPVELAVPGSVAGMGTRALDELHRQEQIKADIANQAGEAAGPLGRIAGRGVIAADDALKQAGQSWAELQRGMSLAKKVENIGLSDETRQLYEPASNAANGLERFVADMAGLPTSMLDPKAIAAMLVAKYPAGAVMGHPYMQAGLGMVGRVMGPQMQAAVTQAASGFTGGASFGAAHGAIQGNPLPDVGEEALQAGILGGVLHAPRIAKEVMPGRAPAAPDTFTPDVQQAYGTRPPPEPVPSRYTDAARTGEQVPAEPTTKPTGEPVPPDALAQWEQPRTESITITAVDPHGDIPVGGGESIHRDALEFVVGRGDKLPGNAGSFKSSPSESTVVPGQQLGLLGDRYNGGITGKQGGLPFSEPSALETETRARQSAGDAETMQMFGNEKPTTPKAPTVDIEHAKTRVKVLVRNLSKARDGPRPSSIVGREDGLYSELRAHLRDLRDNDALDESLLSLARKVYDEAGLTRALESAPKAAGKSGEVSYSNPSEAMGAAAGASGTFKASPFGQLVDAASVRGKQIVNTLAGRTLPRMVALNEDAANATARYASARIAAPLISRDMAAKVMGEKYKDADFARKLGAVLVEDRLRAIRDSLPDPTDKANVRTLVGGPDSPFKTEADFQAALADPDIKAAIEQHKKLVQPEAAAMHLDLGGKEAQAGPNTGAFVNLEAVLGDDQPPSFAGGAKGNLMNPIKKGSKFNKGAKGTAAVYELDYNRLVERMMSGNLEETLKQKMYQSLIDSGLAVEAKPGATPEIDGKPAARIQIVRKGVPRFDDKGEIVGAKTHTKDLWVKPAVYRELRNALNVDLDVTQPWFIRAVNAAQLAAPTDAVYHTANFLMAASGQVGGKSFIADVGRMIPGVNVVDTVARMFKRGFDVVQDSPEIRTRLAEIAAIGAGRQPHPTPEGKIGKILHRANPLSYLGDLVRVGDQASRLVMDDLYRNAVDRGLTKYSEANRRDFINRIGQYNGRLMGEAQRAMRNVGISPFVVAGRNFNRLAIKKLLQTPGFKAATPEARIKMVATTLAGTALTLGIPAIINYAAHGDPMGGPGTPVGAIDLGKTDDGKRKYIDPLKWTGLRRGMRITGIQALSQGDGAGRAAQDIAGGLGHPWAGPWVDAAVVAMTGYGAGGFREAPYAKKNENQFLLNVENALTHINPLVSGIQKAREEGAKSHGESLAEYVKSFGPAFGYGERKIAKPKRKVFQVLPKP